MNSIYRNASNKRPGAYLIFLAWGGRLFEGGRLFVAKIWDSYSVIFCLGWALLCLFEGGALMHYGIYYH